MCVHDIVTVRTYVLQAVIIAEHTKVVQVFKQEIM